MINKITMANVASYKQETILETDHKINLIYGLNGSGKSTLSDFLYCRKDIDFSTCSIYPPLDDNTKVLVYNQSFINDNFYQCEAQPGIFSLSKENKEAQKRIENYNKELEELKSQRKQLDDDKIKHEERFKQIKGNAEEQIWNIKSVFTGGDRVLDFCLDGFKTSKTKLFDYILTIVKAEIKPEKTIEGIKQDVKLLNENSDPINISIPTLTFPEAAFEKDSIFKKVIVGNDNSSIASLIKQLNNQNWVREGFQYIESQPANSRRCPFCQSATITDDFAKKLKDFFSKEYEQDIKRIADIGQRYKISGENIKNVSITFFDTVPFLNDLKKEFTNAQNSFCDIIQNNLELMRQKYSTPNMGIELKSSQEPLGRLNDILQLARKKVDEFNQKISQRKAALNELKNIFWQIQRWEYDQTISAYITSKQVFEKEAEKIDDNIKKIYERNIELNNLILAEQKNTVNIKEAIDNINNNLLSIGIDSFRLDSYQDNLYKITRTGQNEAVFLTLSEGEKMMISFLYFLELCREKQSTDEVITKKIVVIDDPISSLSHIYVFNVCRLIKDFFFGVSNQYEQIFILTHSLYFFHELFKMHPNVKYSDTDDIKSKKMPKLYRICKNTIGSYFCVMEQNEIQSDYQAYWTIIKDREYHGAIIANAMRNILEYFFGFIDKCDLNGIFQKPKFSDNKYQAFVRFMNARSHSTGELAYDYNEVDYDMFIEALHAVFTESQYEDHYKKMMGE